MAEKTAHTRRWKVLESDKPSPIYNGIVCMIAASDRVIAVVTEDGLPFDPEDWPAAARLIASAPAMLAALEAAPRPGGEGASVDPVEYMDWFFKARLAALARAKDA